MKVRCAMEVGVVSESAKSLTLQVTIDISEGTFLNQEEQILAATNAVGRKATELALKKYDTSGEPIDVNGKKYTARTQSNKAYHTPFGKVQLARRVYQTSAGGKIYCPLDERARIIRGATPRFGKMISNKYARMNANECCSDMFENHGTKVTLSYLQNLAEYAASLAQLEEQPWTYHLPDDVEDITVVTMSVDGAMLLTREGGYREAMVSAISLYDRAGERKHSIYFGASPEYGKSSFKERFKQEADRIKELYPSATCLGIADGARDNWTMIGPYVDHELIDFYHASEYLSRCSHAAYPQKTGKPERTRWIEDYCHILKHDPDGAQTVLNELRRVGRKNKLSKENKKNAQDAMRYFKNNMAKMDYAKHLEHSWPIGSGVTEAACKTLIKQRFGRSGMRWKDTGIKTVLSLRELVLTPGRWSQLWENYMEGAQAA